jgi:hypothetical protein
VRRVGGLLAVGFVLSCSTSPGSPDASAQDGSLSDAAAYASGCVGTCVATACQTQIAACNADPTCASYFACVGQCPTTSNGDADPMCVAGCPAATGSAGSNAQATLDACREESLTGTCAACNGGDGGTGNTSCADAAVLNQTCGASTQTNACLKCQDEKCCNSVATVTGGGPTTDYTNCILACNDADAGAVNGNPSLACLQACVSAYPAGIAGVGQFYACVKIECDAVGACPTTSCATCSFQQCGCEYVACETDVACELILQCEGTCTTQACADACISNADGGVEVAQTYGVCITQHCLTECGQ